MENAILREQINAANVYENFFVPALFEEWALRVADGAQIRVGQRVLDVACGTGVLAREAWARAKPGGFVAGVDPNPGMLSVAAQRVPEIEWRRGTAEALPFADRSFDAVVSQFGLMFFVDRVKAVQEMLRVLISGGRLCVAVWDSLEQTPAYNDEVALLERTAGRAIADVLRAPFALGDREALLEIFTQAGADWIAVSTLHGTGVFPSVRSMVEADLRGWMPAAGVVLSEEQIQSILEEAEQELSRYVTETGRVLFDSPAHLVTGVKS